MCNQSYIGWATFALYGQLNNTGAFVERHNVGSVMTFRSNLNVTACAVEMLRFWTA